MKLALFRPLQAVDLYEADSLQTSQFCLGNGGTTFIPGGNCYLTLSGAIVLSPLNRQLTKS